MITLAGRMPKRVGTTNGDGGPFRHLLRRLLAIEPGPHRVVSCYIRLGPQDREGQKYLGEVKRRIVAAWEAEADRDIKRIVDYLADQRNLPPGRGLALFASSPLRLFEVAPLPIVHRTRVVVDDTPWVRELIAIDQDFGDLVAVVMDRAHARFFTVTAFEACEEPGLLEPSQRGGKFHSDRRDSPGWGEAAYHGRIKEERQRHFDAIDCHLDALVRVHRPRGILLAGPQKEIAALGKYLRPRLAHLVLGHAKLNPTAVSPAEVQAAAFAAASADQDREIATLVATFDEALGTRWAVNGARETLWALARGQVRTLLVREGAELEGFRCSISKRLVLTSAECRGLGHPTPILDLVDEAVEDALRQGVQVIVLQGAAGAQITDLAAFLRFR